MEVNHLGFPLMLMCAGGAVRVPKDNDHDRIAGAIVLRLLRPLIEQ